MKSIVLRIFSMFFCVVFCSVLLGCISTEARGEQNDNEQKTYTFSDGFFRNNSYTKETLYGFSFPQLTPSQYEDLGYGEYFWTYGNYCQQSYISIGKNIREDEDALELFKGVDPKCEEVLEDKVIEIDNHLAYLRISRWTRPNDKRLLLMGSIYYYRNNYRFEIQFFSPIVDKKDWGTFSKMTVKDLEEFARYISYDDSTAQFTAESGSFSVKIKDNQTVLSAGKSLSLSIEYDNPNCIQEFESAYPKKNRKYNKKRDDAIIWSVIDLDTGEESKKVTIDKNDTVRADKRIDRIMNVEIRAKSVRYTSKASYPLTVIPAVRTITVDPKELAFYEGTTDSAAVKAALEPSCVPLSGITWTAENAKVVNIEPNETDGTAVVTPLMAGKTTITVKEPGGKNTKLKVNVMAPVESVELAVKGNVKAGGKVSIVAALLPKNVGNKTVQWSLDVGEDIAAINEKGQLAISKDAPSGTKITVTCTALGAPSPVTASTVVEVP